MKFSGHILDRPSDMIRSHRPRGCSHPATWTRTRSQANTPFKWKICVVLGCGGLCCALCGDNRECFFVIPPGASGEEKRRFLFSP